MLLILNSEKSISDTLLSCPQIHLVRKHLRMRGMEDGSPQSASGTVRKPRANQFQGCDVYWPGPTRIPEPKN